MEPSSHSSSDVGAPLVRSDLERPSPQLAASPSGHPRTSVVIPARNAAGTLCRTLDSLLAQSDSNWEALVVDDGSTDATPQIIGAYARRDGRFTALRTNGVGSASAARNVGLSHARGRRLLFLDSDDWIDERFLETMNAALAAAPDAVAAYCGYCRVMPDGQQTAMHCDPGVALTPFERFARTCAVAIHAVLIERELVMRIGGFDPSLRTCEDWDLWQRAARMGGRWVQVDAALSYYRMTAGSLTEDVGQMLDDAAVVIGRGFGADPRLVHLEPACPEGASSTDGRTGELAYAYIVLWSGALECVRNRSSAAVMQRLGRFPLAVDAASIAITLIEGLAVGLRATPAQLAARWREFGPRLTAWIAELGRFCNDAITPRAIQYRVERLILDHDDLAEPRQLSLTLGLRVDLRNPQPVTPPPGVDRLYVYLCNGTDPWDLLDFGVLGTITTRHWLELAAWRLRGFRTVASCAGGHLIRSLTLERLGSSLHEARAALRGTGTQRAGKHPTLKAMARQAFFGVAGPALPAGSHAAELDRLRREAESSNHWAPTEHRDAAVPTQRDHGEETASNRSRRDYWEGLFRKPDPWNYGSPYEQEKYARQLMLLPDDPIRNALELACAEGRFTEMLAPRVQRLTATDISTTALERARDRCRSRENVTFRQLDFVSDPLPESLDLIVCSEVLYYLEDDVELARVAERLARALRPGGHIIIAHAFVLSEDLSRTGFDWGHRWGAKTISRVFQASPGLSLECSLSTELYRIDRFVRLKEGQQACEPRTETLPLTAEIEIEVGRHILWGGASARRAELAVTEQHPQIPVLMYHRIAQDGPDELAPYRVSREAFRMQMAWLRRNGYHTIVSQELAWFLENSHAFPGRPVMITFDDGYQDFADHAWPILRSHDFRAEVFVVTDRVGQSAEWDRHLGSPAPLMDTATLMTLAAEGVAFGSHLASHRGADGLSTRELVEELTRSRAMLQQWLGRPVESFTAPFGITDERLRLLAADCGYRIGFNTTDGPVRLGSDPLDLPRIEVPGNTTSDEFIRRLEACR